MGDWLLWTFLIGGVLLVGSELFHGTLWTAFFGLSALAVAALLGLGVVASPVAALAVWGGLSLALSIPLVPIARKFLPAKSRHDPSHEDDDAYGQIVDVLEPVLEGEVRGRIRFQGSTWPALCVDGSVPAGGRAKLVARRKIAWIVEPLGELEAADLVPKQEG
jgi:inner membrane protein